MGHLPMRCGAAEGRQNPQLTVAASRPMATIARFRHREGVPGGEALPDWRWGDGSSPDAMRSSRGEAKPAAHRGREPPDGDNRTVPAPGGGPGGRSPPWREVGGWVISRCDAEQPRGGKTRSSPWPRAARWRQSQGSGTGRGSRGAKPSLAGVWGSTPNAMASSPGEAQSASRGRPATSGRRDSNPRPSPWQGDALPAALRPRAPVHRCDAQSIRVRFAGLTGWPFWGDLGWLRGVRRPVGGNSVTPGVQGVTASVSLRMVSPFNRTG